MIPRTSTINPTDMLTSVYYNEAIFVGKGGYYKGNKNYQCVNYAIGRTCELAKLPVTYYSGISTKEQIDNPMFNRSGYGNAVSWMNDTLWEKGKVPKLGAVMVYGSAYGNGYGHVRVVEKIENNKLFISGGNESKQMAFKWIDIPKITATGFLGYIYNPYVKEEDMLIKFKKDTTNYEYKWSVDGNAYGQPYDVTTEKGFADSKLEKEGWELILKVNGSLFYTYEDAHYACGLEKSRGVNNQELGMSCVSDYNTCMSIAGFEQDLYFGSQEWIIKNMLDKSYCAITGMGLILGGSKRSDMKKGFESQWSCRSGRTVIGEDKDGNFLSYSFAGETGKSGLTCTELQNKCLSLGFHNAICLDGGGSVFRQYLNEQGNLVYDISTTRKVKNALMLYRRKLTKEPLTQEAYDELKLQYDTLKNAYDVVLDSNDDLKEMLEKVIDEKTNLTNQLTQEQKIIKSLSTKIEKAKKLLEEGEEN